MSGIGRDVATAISKFQELFARASALLNDAEAQATIQRLGSIAADLQSYFENVRDVSEIDRSDPLTILDQYREQFRRRAEPIERIANFLSVMREFNALLNEDEEEQAALRAAEVAMIEVSDAMVGLPDRLFENVLHTIAELDITPSEEDLRKFSAQFAITPRPDQDSILYLAQMLTSEDTVGIILRGHVFIERALRKCIDNYVPKTHLISKRLTFYRTTEFAEILALITSDEAELIIEINKLRNKLAHSDFTLLAADERAVWNMFIKSPKVDATVWPTYDASRCPEALIHVMIYVYVILEKRATELTKLPAIADMIIAAQQPLDCKASSAVVRLLVRAVRAMKPAFSTGAA